MVSKGKGGGSGNSSISKSDNRGKSGEVAPVGSGVAPQNGGVLGAERARRANNTFCLFSVGVAIGVLGLAYILRPSL